MEKHMQKSSVRNWSEGIGDRAHQHFEIWYGEEERKTKLVARVWRRLWYRGSDVPGLADRNRPAYRRTLSRKLTN